MQTKPSPEIVSADHVEIVGDPSQPKKQTLFERLLSPESLNWMMGCGAGLLVIGFVVWLWTIGIFENPLILSVSIGAGNLGLLGLGVWMYKATRYKLAGNGIGLLGALVLPLNLWLYDAQGLINLIDGDPLWLPALGFCAVYAFIARITKNPMYVYTLVGGIVLTGLLFLAGPKVGLLWALLPTSTFLMIVGAVAIHADRWFIESEGEYSRERFGKAFFRAGHMALLGGVAFLIGGELIPFASEFSALSIFGEVTGEGLISTNHKIWATMLSLFATYVYGYSHATRPRKNLHALMAGASMVWAALTAFTLLQIPITFNLVSVAIGLALIAGSWWLRVASKSDDADSKPSDAWAWKLGLGAASLALVAVSQFLFVLSSTGLVFVGWMHVLHLMTASIACWSVPGVWQSENRTSLMGFFVATGSSALSIALIQCFAIVMPSASLSVIGLCGLVLPVLILVSSLAVPRSRIKTQLAVANSMSLITLTSVGILFALENMVVVPTIVTMGFTLAGSLLFFAIAYTKNTREEMVPGMIMVGFTVVQVFFYFNITSAFAVIAAISSLGLIGHFLSKVTVMVSQEASDQSSAVNGSVAQWLHNGANVLIVAGVGATVLFTLSEISLSNVSAYHLGLLAFQLATVAIGYVVSKHVAWKQSMNLSAVALLGTAVITFSSLSELPVIRRLEIGSLVTGLIAIAASYLGWSKEEEGQSKNELVSFGFVAGTLLMVLPMLIGFIDTRFFGVTEHGTFWFYFHEIGTLAVGLILLGSGVLAKVRSTTIGGATLCGMFVFGLVALIRFPGHLNTAAVMMMVGGGVFFTVAILLSLYRDRILSLPERVRDGKGLFRVLKWR